MNPVVFRRRFFSNDINPLLATSFSQQCLNCHAGRQSYPMRLFVLIFFHEAFSTDLGCQGFHLPILIESNRAQPPLGNLLDSSLRLPQVTQVTPPCRSFTGNFASGCGKKIL